jgi:shikimate dehydrogenase
MRRPITGQTLVAGVTGAPVTHSLSPTLHNAWLAATGIDGVYVAFRARTDAFAALVEGLRGGVVRGLNVTAPFKEEALALADRHSPRAQRSGSANLLVFEPDGMISADNTDGEGLLHAFRIQASGFDVTARPVTIWGAGGAARGAAAALQAAGAPRVDVVNRTPARAEALATALGSGVRAIAVADADPALREAGAVINATPMGSDGAMALQASLTHLPADAVVMDMVYRPLRTGLLEAAQSRGLRTVDGLEMLIGQAIPSFKAFFGAEPPPIDVRGLALAGLEDAG